MAKLVVELESDKLENAEEECSRILRDIADKLDSTDGRSNPLGDFDSEQTPFSSLHSLGR